MKPRKTKAIDLIGMKINSWQVLGLSKVRRKNDAVSLVCQCICYNLCVVDSNSLRAGTSKSCGCWKIKHGYAVRRTPQTPEYKLWRGMKRRCDWPEDTHFKYYGGRGIKYCDRWNDFNNFIADMGKRPEGCSLDRIDVNGNYEPGNCRWATWREQMENKSNNRRFTFNGETLLAREWAERYKLSETAREKLRARLRHGMDLNEALEKPLLQGEFKGMMLTDIT